MNGGAKAVGIIPVRLGSQRLPRKALLADSGQPLFLHTYERTRRAACFEQVLIATDSDEIAEAAQAAGAPVVLTSSACRTGSERCAEAARDLVCDIAVDIQGDWPEIDPADLDALVGALASSAAPISTLATPLADEQRARDPNVVKVVADRRGQALYFSRAAIPHGAGGGRAWLRHIGVYAFRRAVLLGVPELPSSGLAETESLEQLRFLENGLAMQVVTTDRAPWGIESPDDYQAFLRRLDQGDDSSS